MKKLVLFIALVAGLMALDTAEAVLKSKDNGKSMGNIVDSSFTYIYPMSKSIENNVKKYGKKTVAAVLAKSVCENKELVSTLKEYGMTVTYIYVKKDFSKALVVKVKNCK